MGALLETYIEVSNRIRERGDQPNLKKPESGQGKPQDTFSHLISMLLSAWEPYFLLLQSSILHLVEARPSQF